MSLVNMIHSYHCPSHYKLLSCRYTLMKQSPDAHCPADFMEFFDQ